MKLTIREDSKNYCATVVKLPPKQAIPSLDKLVKVTVFGNDVLTQKDTDEDQLYLFFPAECAISAEYLSKNNEFRESTLNIDHAQTGYFDPSGRVKAIKFKGVISTGYLAPVTTLYPILQDKVILLLEGMEFTDIDGINICKKYIPKHLHIQGQGNKESRYNKKLKRFDKLVPNQFRFHQDTSHLAKNLHLFNPDDIIVITDKWHGTSAVFGNVLINTQLTWFQKLAAKLVLPSIKKYLIFKDYDYIYSSRSVVKNQYINKEQGGGYYGEDIWAVVNKELTGKIETGIILYGEIVGYLPSGKMIQKAYDYSCSPGLSGKASNITNEGYIMCTDTDNPEHKFLVYRITYTKPNGEVIEFSWQQIKEYCKKYSIEHVKELYFGRAFESHEWTGDGRDIKDTTNNYPDWREKFFEVLQKEYLEKDCPHCRNKVPAEGVIVRIDGKQTYSAYKLKSKRFLERETKALDAGEVSIEDEQADGNNN